MIRHKRFLNEELGTLAKQTLGFLVGENVKCQHPGFRQAPCLGRQRYPLGMGSDSLSGVSAPSRGAPGAADGSGWKPSSQERIWGGLTGSVLVFHNSQKTGARKTEDGALTAAMTTARGRICSEEELLERPSAVRLMVATKPEPCVRRVLTSARAEGRTCPHNARKARRAVDPALG